MRDWMDVVKYFVECGCDVEIYDFVTALRGIDTEFPTPFFDVDVLKDPEYPDIRTIFKLLTTAVLRGTTMYAYGIQDTIRLLQSIDTEKKIKELEDILRFGFSLCPHFYKHFLHALYALESYYRQIGESPLADIVSKMILALENKNLEKYIDNLEYYLIEWRKWVQRQENEQEEDENEF